MHITVKNMDFNQWIADLEADAEARGISINKLCEEVNIARSTWTRWKRGDTMPALRTMQRIEAALESQAA